MSNKAWVVAVDMGYGHQRAAYPLRHLSPNGQVINANNYQGIPDSDLQIWRSGRRFYEFVSRLTALPILGDSIFNLYDRTFQQIAEFYPRRDLSKPDFQLKWSYKLIKRGWGKDLIEYLNQEDIPLITTFFTVAFFAEEHKFKNEIYLVVCDSDISRAWVALEPKKSRIKYLAPCRRVVDRLKEYGVKPENIFLTGFPLPEENLGNKMLDKLRSDIIERIINLDPKRKYFDKFSDTVKSYLGDINQVSHQSSPISIVFAVGGAGAQKKLAEHILLSLKSKLLKQEINLTLVAGVRNDVYKFFHEIIKRLGLESCFNLNLHIIFEIHKEDYFRRFNEALREADVLWTKPSELVFYSALGLPIIISPPIGSQERFNKTWLKTIGAGIKQPDERYTDEWLTDWIESGWLAEAAVSGYLDGRQFGVRNMEDVIFNNVKQPELDDNLTEF